MDSGEEISGLDEGWTFLGAKLAEWIAGLTVFLIIAELFFKRNMNSGMPVMLGAWLLTTISLSRLRKTFPDEENGVKNHFMVKCGFKPPGMPAPADFQPYWSGAPLERLSPKSEFVLLGFDKVFFKENVNFEEAETPVEILKELEKENKSKRNNKKQVVNRSKNKV